MNPPPDNNILDLSELNAEDAQRLLRAMTFDAAYWFAHFAKIRTKEGAVLPVPAVNRLQERVLNHYRFCQLRGIPCLIMILKPRQKGASTIAEGVIYHHMRRYPELNGVIMGDVDATSEKVFAMFKRYAELDLFPWGDGLGQLSDDQNKAEHITLPNGSTYSTETAGSKNAGRSGTVQVLHLDEVAFFNQDKGKDPTTAVLGSFAKDLPKSLGFATSTANGATGWFYETWNGKNAWHKIFAAWFEFDDSRRRFADPDEEAHFKESMTDDEKQEQQLYPEVTLEHLNWRRNCINTDYSGDVGKFRQEMPSNDEECLTAETRVGTSSGIFRIAEILEGVLSDHGFVVAKKSKGVRPVFKLTTRDGYCLRGTSDHRIALDAGGFAGLADCVGKRIRLHPPIIANGYHTEQWTGFGGVNHSLPIDEKWGAFIGYYMGDGCMDNDSMELVCDAQDMDVVAGCEQLLKDLWGRDFTRQIAGTKRGAVRLRLSDMQFGPIMERLGLAERASDKRPRRHYGSGLRRNICVPECIWLSPRPVLREFLRWLFEADGWTSKDNYIVKFFSYRPCFIRDVQRLLLAFGIRSIIRAVIKTDGNGKKFPGEELCLRARDAVKFHAEIGFVSARKNTGMASKPKVFDGRAPNYGMADEVVSVEPDGQEEVWDIQIEGEPVFSANGILVHNCFLLSSSPRFFLPSIKALTAEAKTNDKRRRCNLLIQNKSHVTMLPDDKGDVLIQEEPIVGCRYIGALDTMTGEDQSTGATAKRDWHSAQIWRAGYMTKGGDWQRPALVALHHSQVDTDILVEIFAAMSIYYGRCMTIPEINGQAGIHIVKELQKYKVPMFRRRAFSASSKRKMTDEEVLGAYGWNTDRQTKKWLIDALVPMIRKEELDVKFPEVLDEFRTFIINANGTCEAMTGKHDDHVVAAGMAVYCIGSATEYRGRPGFLNEANDGWRVAG